MNPVPARDLGQELVAGADVPVAVEAHARPVVLRVSAAVAPFRDELGVGFKPDIEALAHAARGDVRLIVKMRLPRRLERGGIRHLQTVLAGGGALPAHSDRGPFLFAAHVRLAGRRTDRSGLEPIVHFERLWGRGWWGQSDHGAARMAGLLDPGCIAIQAGLANVELLEPEVVGRRTAL